MKTSEMLTKRLAATAAEPTVVRATAAWNTARAAEAAAWKAARDAAEAADTAWDAACAAADAAWAAAWPPAKN